VQQSLISVGMVFITSIINSFGANATAAAGAGMRIDQLAFMPAMTLGMAASSLAGQNIGASRHDRIREILFWGCLFSGGMTLLATLVAVSIPTLLLHIFIDDPAVVEIGVMYLRTVGACYIFFAVMFVSNGIINGSGHTLVTTMISLISLWAVRVPLAYSLSRRMGIRGVWVAIALSFAVSTICSMLYYLSGRWRRVIGRKPAGPASPEAIFGEETGEA
jgi:Na+-driven multidrug efflux pump